MAVSLFQLLIYIVTITLNYYHPQDERITVVLKSSVFSLVLLQLYLPEAVGEIQGA